MKRFDRELLSELRAKAEASPRRRAHHNVHEDYQQPVQRLFVCMLPDSYVRPHRHSQPTKWEFFMVVEGCLELLFFDDNGTLTERLALGPQSDVLGVEIPPNTWHATVCHAPVTFVEVKQGPYEVTDDKDFAAWAPKEGETQVPAFLSQLKTLKTGEAVRL
ncbi:WbuC family cupin fold metalloprotein [Alteromonas gilva]|uniref:WbuC family cupin fold metalloprotein n=1 Tax=Alteromonas gilva TaxID=2987522 RepID=A0ABT5KYI2_9ALTE|nr:WbuC family cupin fold metalloprotein [Alteromonas gilva]MDC8829266.1 WbuC family cupin fold metalloprotein [Alteromonas gilva]